VLKATGGKGVNLIVDQVSGYVANGNMQACALLARIVNVGRLGGTKAEFNFDLHALKRIDYIGVTFRTRTVEEVREISRRMRADIWDAVAAGKLHLPIDRTFPLDEAAAAHAHNAGERAFREDRAGDVGHTTRRSSPRRRGPSNPRRHGRTRAVSEYWVPDRRFAPSGMTTERMAPPALLPQRRLGEHVRA